MFKVLRRNLSNVGRIKPKCRLPHSHLELALPVLHVRDQFITMTSLCYCAYSSRWPAQAFVWVCVCVCVMQGVIYIQTAHALWRVQVRVSKCELLLCGGFRADLTEAFCIQNSISISNRPVRSQHHVLFSNRQILITCMHIFLIYIAYQILDFDMDMTERVYVHIEYASPYAAGF